MPPLRTVKLGSKSSHSDTKTVFFTIPPILPLTCAQAEVCWETDIVKQAILMVLPFDQTFLVRSHYQLKVMTEKKLLISFTQLNKSVKTILINQAKDTKDYIEIT